MDCAAWNPTIQFVFGNPVTWAASAAFDFKLDFLQALKGERLSLIYLGLHTNANLTTAAGEPFDGRSYPSIYNQTVMEDNGGERVVLREGGAVNLRVAQRCQSGPGTRGYGTLPADIAAATTTDRRFVFPIYQECQLLERPSQSRILLADLTRGRLQVSTSAAVVGSAAANRATVNSGTMTPFAVVIDEGPPEAGDERGDEKIRVCYRTIRIQNNQDTYQIVKQSRILSWDQFLGDVGFNVGAAPGTSTWARQTLTVETPRMSQLQDEMLVAYYGSRADALNNAVQDMVLTGHCLPIYAHRTGQGLLQTPKVDALAWRTSDTFGAGTFLAANLPCHILITAEPRPGECADGGRGVVLNSGQVVPASIMGDAAKILPTRKLSTTAQANR